MENELVSICIPVFNGGNYLEQVIECAIMQSYKTIEIIIVDDCSTDNSFDIINKYALLDSRIRIFRNNQNIGIGGNWNKAISIAKGKYLSLWHQDDLYHRNFIQTYLQYFNKYENIGVAFSRVYFINSYGRIILKSKYFNIKKDCFLINYSFLLSYFSKYGNIHFVCPTAFFNAEVFKECGIFDNKLQYALDIDMWIRISEKFSILFINDFLTGYRISPTQTTNIYKNNILSHSDFFQVIEKKLLNIKDNEIYRENLAKLKFKDLLRIYSLNNKLLKKRDLKKLLIENFYESKYYINKLRFVNYLDSINMVDIIFSFFLIPNKIKLLLKQLLSKNLFFLRKFKT